MEHPSVANTGSPCRALVVELDALARSALETALAERGCHVVEVARPEQGPDEAFDLVVLGGDLPGFEVLEALGRLHAAHPGVPVLVVDATPPLHEAVAAIRGGTYPFLPGPVDTDAVAVAIERAREVGGLRQHLRDLRRRGPTTGMLGEAPPMQRVRHLVDEVARSAASTVLLMGESGTGKGVVARAIHELGARAERAFINVTCSALPSTLLESELFGHERGAFTDAKVRKLGLLEEADGGTVFLDEIGELDPSLQTKLLRFLEDETFRRVGGTRDLHTDVRVIAATNVDLRRAVHEGRFREDLFYRLAVVTIELPPLRERLADVDLLAQHFLAHFARELGKPMMGLDESARRTLRGHPWPGNVRELRNALERAVLLAEEPQLDAEDFGFLREGPRPAPLLRPPEGGLDIRALEQSLVEQALSLSGGNQTRAAALLGMHRDQIRYRLRRYEETDPQEAADPG